MAIQNLNEGTPTTASQIPFYDPASGQDRRTSVAALQALGSTSAAGMVTQYAAPAATGFNVQIVPPMNGTSMFLLLTPVAGYAAGTITLPAQATCADKQELLCACTQAVAALTVTGNGATVNGAPAALTANGFFRLRFDGVFRAWYRID